MYPYPRLASPVVISPPEIEPVSLEEMKRHMRIDEDQTDEDDDIETFITAARDYVEQYTGRTLIDTTWELGFEGYPEWQIFLVRPPILSIVSFVYTNSDGTETTLAADQYTLDRSDLLTPRLVPAYNVYWPSTRWQPSSLKIRYRAGYVDRTGSPTEGPELVPAGLRAAVKMLAAHLFENREATKEGQQLHEVPFGVLSLCRPFRVEGLCA